VLTNQQRASGGGTTALYRPTNGAWQPSLIGNAGSLSGTDFVLQPGMGYLLYTPAAITFAPYRSYSRPCVYSYDGLQSGSPAPQRARATPTDTATARGT
jgi:hypothetical protein